MGIEPTQDLLGPTLVLKTRGTTRHQSPPRAWPSGLLPVYALPGGNKRFFPPTCFGAGYPGKIPVMRSLTAHILLSACVALAVVSGVRAQPAESADPPQTIHLEPYHGSDVTHLIGFGNCQWLRPLDEPNETLVSEPAYKSSKRVYYAAHYGDAKDNTHTFVIDESGGTGTGFDTLYADLNNDNRLDRNTEKFPLTLSGLTTSTARNVRLLLSVQAGGKTIPYGFDFTAFRYKDTNNPVEKIHANCRGSSIMVGEAVFGPKRCKVALADLNSNGLFNDCEQDLFRGDRFFVDLNGNGKYDEDSPAAESFPYAQYAQIDGRWYTVEASPDGQTIRIQPSQPTFGTVKAPAKVKSAGLSSPRQFQRLTFKDGPAEALTGVYQVRDITLEITDERGQWWTTTGQYRKTGPQLAVEPNRQAMLEEVLPLTIRVAVLPTSEPGVVELEPRIVDRCGGTFGTIRQNSGRYEPPASLVIKDAAGKTVVEADLKYG